MDKPAGQTMIRRDSNLDLYRLILMFGICFLHSITVGDFNRPWLANIFLASVNGFVFITGWYGSRFAPSKIIKLYGTALFCGMIVYLWGGAMGYSESLPSYWELATGPWFLNAYVAMMCVTPLIDLALDSKEQMKKVLIPLVLLIFGWSAATSMPIIGKLIPQTTGLGAYTWLTLVGVYLVARLCRFYDLESRLDGWRIFLVLVPCLMFALCGLGDYSSPFATGIALSCFFLVKRIKSIPLALQKCLVYAAPSMFSIYLLQVNPVGFTLIKKAMFFAVNNCELSVYVSYCLVAATVFFSCFLIDQVRRLIVWMTRPIWTPVLKYIDNRYLQFVTPSCN